MTGSWPPFSTTDRANAPVSMAFAPAQAEGQGTLPGKFLKMKNGGGDIVSIVEVTSRPEQGPPRLAALRKQIANRRRLTGFWCPRRCHQGLNMLPPAMDRLSGWTAGLPDFGWFLCRLRIAGGRVIGRALSHAGQGAGLADVYTPGAAWPRCHTGDWAAHRAAFQGRHSWIRFRGCMPRGTDEQLEGSAGKAGSVTLRGVRLTSGGRASGQDQPACRCSRKCNCRSNLRRGNNR